MRQRKIAGFVLEQLSARYRRAAFVGKLHNDSRLTGNYTDRG